MADSERENSYYHPGGVPVTPQARKFGYEFPVYVSKSVWAKFVMDGGIASRHGQTVDRRIWALLQHCYDGMIKRLATADDFLFYYFKVWYWDRYRPEAKKQARARLAARLFLDPSTNGPWLYIFDSNVDTIDALTKGEVSDEIPVKDDGDPAHVDSDSGGPGAASIDQL